MKTKLLKFMRALLVAVLLGVGANAWADDVASYDFNSQTTPFTIYDGNRLSVSYAEHVADGGDYYAKYSCGNMNAVAFAYYNFASSVSDAETVTTEFDFYVSKVSGHLLISLADANYHTGANGGFSGGSNTGYGSTGAIFNLGCYRANKNDDFAINSTQNSNLTSTCLGNWCHASVTVNNSTKKVSYTITDSEDNELASETDVNFLNASAQRCSQIDFYIGTNAEGNAVQIDNLVITKTVSTTEHDYTINAVAGETVIKKYAT